MMPRMKKPAPPKEPPWQATLSIDAFAESRGLTPREVRRLLGRGHLPFVQIAGQIRVPKEATLDESQREKKVPVKMNRQVD